MKQDEHFADNASLTNSDNVVNIIHIGGEGAQWIKKIVSLITPSNLWSDNPFCGEYMGMVIVYKHGAFGFATMKRISVR